MKTKLFAALLASALTPQFVYSANTCRAIFDVNLSPRQNSSLDREAERRSELIRPQLPLDTDLYFKEKVGAVEEHSIREGQAAAHVYLDSTNANTPYLFVAFPAGNSGVGLWFRSSTGSRIEAISQPRAIARDSDLNGIEIPLKTGSKELEIDDTLLGSMRFIRDRELSRNIFNTAAGKFASRIQNHKIQLIQGKLVITRTGINGVTRYMSEIEPLPGTRILQEGSMIRLVSDSDVQFKLTAMTGEKPLNPIALKDFFKEEAIAKMDPKRLLALSFLAYKEKLMAGSPRYFSKFGRDSIYTLRVLMDSMKPEAIESLLSATISSINPRTGQISHEQHEGDYTSFVRLSKKEKYIGVNDPIEDYKMIDDDLAFTATLGNYLKLYPERAREFLSRQDARGIEQKQLVAKLFKFVQDGAKPFVDAVQSGKVENKDLYKYLLGLHGEEMTGQWRDSNAGLGEGKYPFDVNAAFVPAALRALADLTGNASPLNDFYNPQHSAKLEKMFEVWNSRVVPLFQVRVAKENLEAYAKAYFQNSGRDLNRLPPRPNEDISFPAISLDKDGKPVPIMHSDDSLMMTFGFPNSAYLKNMTQRLRLPFPYGLRTEIGMLVANPIFASPDLQTKFGDQRYHGTVIWTMQEDLMIFGMVRQANRSEQVVPASLKKSLLQSVAYLESIIASRGDLGGIEVFSLKLQNGKTTPEPFAGDAKGNSNQLWGHLRLIFPQLMDDVKAMEKE